MDAWAEAVCTRCVFGRAPPSLVPATATAIDDPSAATEQEMPMRRWFERCCRLPLCLAALAATVAVAACSAADDPAPPPPAAAVPDAAHSSRNSLDWWGTYAGTLPCADCAGIATVITLARNGEYRREQTYLGRSSEPFVDTGTFEWNSAGSIIRLEAVDGSAQAYQVGEDRLFHLDQQGKRITGDLAPQYELTRRTGDPRLEDHRWLLVELAGERIAPQASPSQAFLVFDAAASRIGGSSSCNRFSGGYTLAEGDRLEIDRNLITTKMACPPGTVEAEFLQMLADVRGYRVPDDELTLTGADSAPLARFEAATEENR